MNSDFGPKHLIGLAWLFSLIAILLTTLLIIRKACKLGKSFDRAVIRYTCYFMWAWEIIKTIRMINYPDYGPVGYYPLWMAPFHICSMGLYAYLIIGAKKPSPIAEWVKPFGYAVMLVATCIILTIPNSSGILGSVEDWSLCFDNILPYQSWLYHGCLVFVPLYMVLSGFYRPCWSDIYKGATVLVIVAVGAYALNYLFEGSGADFMMLRYGNGNPLVSLLTDAPVLYYVLLAIVAVGGMSLVLAATIGITALVEKGSPKKTKKPKRAKGKCKEQEECPQPNAIK